MYPRFTDPIFSANLNVLLTLTTTHQPATDLGYLRHENPFKGPAYVSEGNELLIVDHWCYLGTAKTEAEIWEVLENRRPQFDRDTYRILVRVMAKLRPLAPKAGA